LTGGVVCGATAGRGWATAGAVECVVVVGVGLDVPAGTSVRVAVGVITTDGVRLGVEDVGAGLALLGAGDVELVVGAGSITGIEDVSSLVGVAAAATPCSAGADVPIATTRTAQPPTAAAAAHVESNRPIRM
jgi:hypothetical protein